MRIEIIQGPNLNLTGSRQTEIYGDLSFDDFFNTIKSKYAEAVFTHYQSDIEGEIINRIQKIKDNCEGLIINAGGYSHTSVAISDAIALLKIPVVEVHLSNIHAREPFRHTSLTAAYCKGVISGFGFDSYELAIIYLLKNYSVRR